MRIIVAPNDGGASVLLQDGENVLKKVELFVAPARPEVVAMYDERSSIFRVTDWLRGPVTVEVGVTIRQKLFK